MNISQPSFEYTLADFDYELPPELIAQTPAQRRDQSRLLRIDAQGGLHDQVFSDLSQFLQPHDLLVLNNTKVIKARLHGRKSTGGSLEALIERILTPTSALAHLKASKSPKPGSEVFFADDAIKAKVGEQHDGLFEVFFEDTILDLLDQHGEVPLPPYIAHAAESEDESRYQTVYAREPGAVAAPTAGLHFDETALQTLQQQGVEHCFVTLHVGAGTFQPVRTEHIKDHIMHAERYSVTEEVCQAIKKARAQGGRVIAVGTTSVRALESAAAQGGVSLGCERCPVPHEDDTRLFITPGYEFKVVDALITNFHLPQSTLLMLVSAFIGIDTMHQAYQHAIEQSYRFFSYGDAMLIEKRLV